LRRRLDPADGGPPRILDHDVVGAPRWSPDGRHLVYPGHGKMLRLDVVDGTSVAVGDDELVVDDCGDSLVLMQERADGRRIQRRGGDGAWRDVFAFHSPTYDLADSLHCDPTTGSLLAVRGPSFMTSCIGDIVVIDREGRTAIDFGVYGAPETFFVDAAGRVQYRHVGPMTPEVWQREFLSRLPRGPALP